LIEENKRLLTENKQKQDKIDELLTEVKKQEILIKNQTQQIEDLLIKSDVQSNTLQSMNKQLKNQSLTLSNINCISNDIKQSINNMTNKNVKSKHSDYITVIYSSDLKPTKQNRKVKENQIWLNTFNGSKINYDKLKNSDDTIKEYYISESNNLDTFKEALNEKVLSEIIEDNYYRSVLLNKLDVEKFINNFKVITSEKQLENIDKSAELINNFIKERINEPIDKIVKAKEYLIKHYDNLHYKKYKDNRCVYVKIDNELKYILDKNTNLDDVINNDWIFKFGNNGRYTEIIPDNDIIDFTNFTNSNSKRIKYENYN
jgi:hypothetical protein